MKKLLLLLPLLAGLGACDDFSLIPKTEEMGELRWLLVDSPSTKTEMPDTNDFFLTIQDADGHLLYEGTYGDSPAYLPVSPGAYTLKVVSIPFSAPAFERPQFGDEQVVMVPSGQTVTVRLICTMLNAGLRLQPSSAFQEAFPGGELYVRQADNQLKYTYDEQRTGYFFADEVSAFLYHQGNEQALFTRKLTSREILTVRLQISEPGSQVSISVDTTRNRTDEDYVLLNALSVSQARAHVGEKGLWVYGYIVGGDLTSNGKSVKIEDIAKTTHLALAESPSIKEKASCLAVELPKGALRDALNLADHPEYIGRKVYLKGDVVGSYYGTTGLKSTSEYLFP
jgi:hypothetical protein